MFLRRTQPRPQVIHAPPLPSPHWLTWCIEQVRQSGITPAYYTDGSYSEEPTIHTIFRPESLTRTASASVIIKDTSAHWNSQPIIILRITNGSDVGSQSVYPMEFLALAASMWISQEGRHNTPTHTDAQSVLDTIAQRHRHFKSAKTSCHIPLRRVHECLLRGVPQPVHVDSHPEDDKSFEEIHGRRLG